MKMVFGFLVILFSGSLALAQSSTTLATMPTTGGTQTSAVSVKDAKEACKKDGKEGKELVLCIKEKVK